MARSFVMNAYAMLAGNHPVVHWVNDGRSFEVVDAHDFERIILPEYFTFTRYATFKAYARAAGFTITKAGKRFTASFFKRGMSTLSFPRSCGSGMLQQRTVAARAATRQQLMLPPPPEVHTDDTEQLNANLRDVTQRMDALTARLRAFKARTAANPDDFSRSSAVMPGSSVAIVTAAQPVLSLARLRAPLPPTTMEPFPYSDFTQAQLDALWLEFFPEPLSPTWQS